MKWPTWKVLLHGVPLIVYLALGFVVYTRVTAWAAVQRADKARLIEQTVATFKAINAENTQLQTALAHATQSASHYRALADRAHRATDQILAAHPIKLAPAACEPYTRAVSSCQQEASNLRTALDTTTRALKAAEANLARNTATLEAGGKVLKDAKCHFPCLDLGVWLGPALTTSGKIEGAIGFGIKLH